MTASVDDSTTGNTNIQSAEYQLDGGTWLPMTAQDGTFDSPIESVTAQFDAPAQAGMVDMCVRGSDALGNTGEPTCAELTVTGPSSQPIYLPIVVK